MGVFAWIGGPLLALWRTSGELVFLLLESLLWVRDLPHSFRRVCRHILQVGVQTLPLVVLMAFFVGMVMAVQGILLRQYGALYILGDLVSLALVKELGPVLTGLLVAGRVGSATAAEIGTMQINEEIPSLVTLGISPVRYLAMPRLVACIVCLPLLTTFANVTGVLGGALVAGTYLDLPVETYFLRVQYAVQLKEVYESLVKSLCFGTIIGVVSCHQGFATRGGAEGVGRSTTRAVVLSSLLIIICDYFVSRFCL